MSAMKTRCTRCDGTGMMELDWASKRTLLLLRQHAGTSAPMLADLEGISLTAMCNRLVKLERLRLAERTRIDGRTTEWRVKERR